MLCVDSPKSILEIEGFDHDALTKDDYLGGCCCELKDVVLNAGKEFSFKIELEDKSMKKKQNIGHS